MIILFLTFFFFDDCHLSQKKIVMDKFLIGCFSFCFFFESSCYKANQLTIRGLKSCVHPLSDTSTFCVFSSANFQPRNG